MRFNRAMSYLTIIAVSMAANIVSAATCLDLKKTSQIRFEKAVFDTCRELSGKNIHPEKRALIRKVFLEQWNSGATVDCMNSCGGNSSCVSEFTDKLSEGINHEVIPNLNSSWCVSGK